MQLSDEKKLPWAISVQLKPAIFAEFQNNDFFLISKPAKSIISIISHNKLYKIGYFYVMIIKYKKITNFTFIKFILF